ILPARGSTHELMDLVRSGDNSSPDELMDLDLAGERRHAGRQCAGEGRRRRGCEGEGGWSDSSEESEEEESSETQRG
ncbi:hypothetical protein U1Q18_038372, partial [Sarracenia purpurea var. burkii]